MALYLPPHHTAVSTIPPRIQFMTPHQQAIPLNKSNQYTAGNQYCVPSPTTPPPWTTEIIQDIRFIQLSVAKLDKLEPLVDIINARFKKLEN